MNETTLSALIALAATIALVHTVLGVDHYLPFVALGRARGWTWRRFLSITALCGLGHVLGSIALGFVGIAAGTALSRLEWIESARGEWAAWGLVIFGTAYAAWGLWRGLRSRAHSHAHVHADGTVHDHGHTHEAEHAHGHGDPSKTAVFWSLFVIFVLGPCEPLIPLFMAPAVAGDWIGIALVAGTFAIVTIGAMTLAASALFAGLSFVPSRQLERWSHALAGAAIGVSGLGIVFLGF